MFKILPVRLIKLAGELNKPLYVVGGACRDFLAGLVSPSVDWDICAPLCAEEVALHAEKAGFAVSSVYKNTGTVHLRADGQDYEFTSFRSDKYVRGRHTPEEVYFTDDIEKDALRRDFKCNAVYYDISAQKFVDPLGGIEDAENGALGTVAAAEKVFGEDGLRLMRLCRIAAQTGFTPTGEAVEGARANRALIDDIAKERIFAELNAVLASDLKYGNADGPYRGLKLLHKIGVLERILPELTLGDGMEQRKDYHDYDVLEHSLRCVKYAHPSIRLAALLHDVGKPYCKINTGRFVGHEKEGERIAAEILTRLRAGNKLKERVTALVRWHMYDLSMQTSENKVRKFIVAHMPILDELLLLKQADYSACKDDLKKAPCVARWENILSKMQSEGVPLTVGQLDVRGDELIGAGICPEQTGKTLEFLLNQCAVNAVENRKEKLIAHALSYVKSLKNIP